MQGTEDSNVGGGSNSNAQSSILSLNYKEYLYAFMLVGICVDNNNSMISRTAAVIQMNISKGMEDAGKQNADFDMTKSYTMVSVTSSAKVGATFLGMFEATDNGDGTTSYEMNFDISGEQKNDIVYNGIIGY